MCGLQNRDKNEETHTYKSNHHGRMNIVNYKPMKNIFKILSSPLLICCLFSSENFSDTLMVSIYPEHDTYIRVSDYQVTNIKNDIFYRGELFSGIYGEYYPCTEVDGKLRRVGMVKDGKLEGVFKGYYESGQLLIEENYSNGILKSDPICMDISGTEMECKELLFIKPLSKESYWDKTSIGYNGQYHISPYLQRP